MMPAYIAHITPRDGVVRRCPLCAACRKAALREARELGARLFGARFTYSVRAQ